MKRYNKEYKLICDDIDLRFGTVNRFNPLTCYLIGKAWISPNNETDNKQNFLECFKSFKNNLKEFLKANNFHTTSIIDYDVCFDTMVQGKKNFMEINAVMKQKEITANIKQIKETFEKDFINIMNDFRSNLIQYNFTVSKSNTKK